MTKTLLDEAAESAKFVAPCPACSFTPGLADNSANQMGQGSNGVHKRGRYKGWPRSSMPVCRFCRGARVVFLNLTCECGMPAVYFNSKHKLWSCGSDECLRSALWRQGLHTSSGNNSGGTGGTGSTMHPEGPVQNYDDMSWFGGG